MPGFSSYQLIAKIGQGGMAEVFKAIKSGPDGFSKTVALKKILPFYSDQPRFIKMLSTEAKINSFLNHPNIVQILDFFEEDGQYCMVLEYVDGCNLKEILQGCKKKNQSLAWQACLYITLETLKALTYAHEKEDSNGPLQIIHRDVSPHNILISHQGEVKLSDFGIARAKIERDETASGVLKGKYRYLSPEQILAETLTPASDLFSMGITLYEMLCLMHPFGEAQEYQTLQKIVDQPHVPLHKQKKGIKPEIEYVVEQALQKNPKDRYSQAKDLYEDLLEIQDSSWVTHGQELFRSLMSNFTSEFTNNEEPIDQTSPLSRTIQPHSAIASSSPSFKKPIHIPLILTFAILLGFGLSRMHHPKDPETSATVPATPISSNIPIANPPVIQKTTISLQKPTGKLNIEGPSGTLIYLNGKKMGLLPLHELNIPTGSYNVLFQNEPLGKKIKTVVIAEKQTARISWE